MHYSSQTLAAKLFLGAIALCLSSAAAAHETGPGHGAAGGHGKTAELGADAVADANGRLWVVTKEADAKNQFVLLRTSDDMGKTWSQPKRVHGKPEPVTASGEARPHIALGPKGEIYITYTKTVAKPHIGDIRFVRSLDGGKTFSEPATVHADREVVTHSFESMVVDRDGRIFIAWIDGRDKQAAKARQQRYAGSGLYYAVSDDRGASFKGDYKVTDHACECCRIGMSLDHQGRPVAMWRHVFEPNIRDHALVELTAEGRSSPPARATFDDWKIDACPHHGPSVAYAADGSRHQVWFNGKDGENAGAMYAMAAPDGKLGKPVVLGSAQAAHPDVIVHGRQVALAWKQFDGQSTVLLARVSDDNGLTWRDRELARTDGESDQPHLFAAPKGPMVLWHTRNEGVRTLSLAKD